MKLHSLAMMTQGKVADGVDESFLPGLTVCSKDSATPVRAVAAQMLGKHFVAGKDKPNPEAVALLMKLAQDESADVRYNAVYHGLTQIPNKSDEVIELLIDIASSNRERGLTEQIALSLESDNKTVVKILDEKLQAGNDIATFEIYAELTGKTPPNSEKYLEMPSSRTRLFVFKGEGTDAEAFKAELESELKANDINNANVQISGEGENYALLLKTYITKDYLVVQQQFADHGRFTITQDMWLTPELEIQIDSMRQAQP